MKTISDLFYKKILIILLLFPLGVFAQGNGLTSFYGKNGKQGFFDQSRKVIIKPQYFQVIYPGFSEGLAFVSKYNYLKRDFIWKCIDTTGKIVFELEQGYRPDESFREGYAVIENSNGYYFVNKFGKKVFNKEFGAACSFSNGYARVSDNRNHTSDAYFIDKMGQRAYHLPNNCSIFQNGISYCNSYLIDTLGNILIDSIDEWTGNDYEYLKVKRNGKWGFVDQKGNIIIDFLYPEDRNRACFTFLDYNTDSIITGTHKNIGFFYEGLASIMKDSLYGFINIQNEIVIEPRFKKVNHFSEGLASVSIDGKKWGFINKEGVFIIEPQYYNAHIFQNGICSVLLKDIPPITGLIINMDAAINKKGEIIKNY